MSAWIPDDCPPDEPLPAPTSLPTLQSNVLRRYFQRTTFTPEDVAGIEFRQLAHFPGIGAKGLANIRAWLQAHGLDLKNVRERGEAPIVESARAKRIDRAIALLRKQGFVVRPTRPAARDE